jgi:uncharacterized repeat protein (TIGR01451 family)
MSKKVTYIIIGIIVLVILIVAGFFYYRENIFSKQLLKVEILGPENAKMGEEIEYTIKYKNNGNFVLEQPKLTFELPDHSLTEDGKLRITRDLKDIYPGSEDSVTIKARLLGKEGDIKVADAVITYKPHNLSVRYESDTKLSTKIDTVPITLTFDLPSKAEKGKDISYVINYFSNIDYPLENMSVRLDPISGFSIDSATPKSLDNKEWKLSTLQKGEGGRITIKGTVSADTGTNVNFSAHLGMWIDGVFVSVRDTQQEVEVIQPQLFISQQINGAANYAASPGETLRYKIFIRNIGSTRFNNIFVSSHLEGSLFDFSTLSSPNGDVRPQEGLVAYDAKEIFDLQNLAPQAEVVLSFSIKLKDSWSPLDAQNNSTVIKNTINASGIEQEFDTKVNANLQILQTKGSLVNDGQGGVSYPITWQVKTLLNNIKNVKVRAVLPLGVTLDDMLSPGEQASHFSFDSTSREVVWTPGDVAVGKTVSITFQVSSVGAQLIGQATASGDDQFTGATIQSTAPGF